MKNKLVYICIMSLLLFVVGCSNNPNKESTIKKTLRITKAKLKKKKRTYEKDITISFAGDVTMGTIKVHHIMAVLTMNLKDKEKITIIFLKM